MATSKCTHYTTDGSLRERETAREDKRLEEKSLAIHLGAEHTK